MKYLKIGEGRQFLKGDKDFVIHVEKHLAPDILKDLYKMRKANGEFEGKYTVKIVVHVDLKNVMS